MSDETKGDLLLMEAARLRMATDSGVRNDLDDVIADLGIRS